MRFDDPVALAYAGIYAAALLLAVWKRRTFPLQDAITVTLVVGFGFTALVYVLAPAYPGAPAVAGASPAEMLFTLLYLGLIAGLLVVAKPLPRVWKGHFVKERLGVGLYKLLIFVLLPLAGLRLFWQTSWANLGFALGDLRGQLLAALLLALLLGGFNLLVGSGAAPIRSRQFSARQVSLGFGLAFLWNLLEVGLVEEFFFRGFLQGRLTGFLGAPVGGICAARLVPGPALLAHAESARAHPGACGGGRGGAHPDVHPGGAVAVRGKTRKWARRGDDRRRRGRCQRGEIDRKSVV